jgi:hypothetical protein
MLHSLMLSKKLLVVLFAGVLATAFSASPPPRQLFFQYENMVWWGTEFGLNRFQSENELWANIRPESTNDLCLDEKTLWVGTDQGIFYADLRYLDWKRYTSRQGLPSDTVVRAVADLDYVYVAGPHGLARFNKLVEQWEPMGDFSGKRIYDMYSNQTQLWVATDAGVFYFDKKFEKWESYTSSKGLLSNVVYRLFYFSDCIWALTDQGFSRYSNSMKTWNSYPFNDIIGSAVNYLLVDATYIWVVSPEGVSRFNATNQAWERFSRNMPIEKAIVTSISTSGTTSWFTTSDGVYSYIEDQRRWKTYTAVDGLSDDVQDLIFTTGQTTLCKKGTSFSFLRPAEDLWYANEIKLTAASGAFKPKWKAHLDETGLGVAAPGGQSINLLGRAYAKIKNKAEFPDPIGTSIGNYITNNNLDSIDTITTSTGHDSIAVRPRYKDFLYGWAKAQLNLNADLNNGRTFRATFDNTDPLGDRRYGAEYRGFGDDNLRRLGWRTDQKTDYFYSTLIDPTYLEGAGMRAEFGDRVGDKKLRRVNTGVWAGWRKTEYMRKLLAFREDNFYELGSGVQNIITESVEIKIDGKVIDPADYSLERTMGLLTFKNEGIANPDSRIEVSCEYQPRIGEFPSFRSRTDDTLAKNLGDSISFAEKAALGMASAENVVVVNDKVQIGVNGVYRGLKEPDARGWDSANGWTQTANQLYAGSVNSKIEMKSDDNKLYLRVVPEVSSSYNDSILNTKQGTGAKLDLYSVMHNFKLKASGAYATPDYITLADQNSVYGRTNHQAEAELVYDMWQQYMPLTIGGGYNDANAGGENREYLQYLISPPNIPSLRLFGMHQGMKNLRRDAAQDSVKTERWNGVVETEWDLPEWGRTILLDRFWINASYSVNALSDSLFYDTLSDTALAVPAFDQRLDHNIFGWLRWSPHKKLQLEGKGIVRLFYDRPLQSDPFIYKGNRIRPEIKLFSQELIPGFTLYGKYLFDVVNDTVSTGLHEKRETHNHRLNSSVLVVPGVYTEFLNPFQLNLGYNLSKRDSVFTCDKDTLPYLKVTPSGIVLDSIVRHPTKPTDLFDHSFSIKPMLDFSEDLHFASRLELSYSYQNVILPEDSLATSSMYSLPTLSGLKIYSEARTAFRERKTRFDLDFNYLTEDHFAPDTAHRQRTGNMASALYWEIPDSIMLKSTSYEVRGKWTERWDPNFRTELNLGFTTTNLDTIKDTATYVTSTTAPQYDTISSGFTNTFSPGILFDWRIQGKVIREFRVQYYIGAELINGNILDLNTNSYAWLLKKSEVNKLDVMLKIWSNFYVRLLCNVSYLIDDKTLKYDLAELKATALF